MADNQEPAPQHEVHHHLSHVIPGEIPIPHGPPSDREYDDYPARDADDDERRIFGQIMRPDDSYSDGVYWADLPWWKRAKFVLRINREEAGRELRATGRMFKKDPLSPLGWYFRHAVIPGAGLGLEGYVLFSIGNLQPLFADVWPRCWDGFKICNKAWVSSVEYLEILGIMVGQIGVGIIADWLGRRWGLIQDAIIMFIGLIMLTASWGTSLQGWVICYAWSLFVYGTGVGGEYPITAVSSLENAVTSGKMSTREDRLHRGRRVTMAFLMQGWGQFINQVVLIVLLVIFNSGKGGPPYSNIAAQFTFRLSFAFPAIGTLWLAYYRTWKLPNPSKQLNLAKNRARVTGYDVNSLKFCFKHFGGRVIATAGAWFCNDVFFYGNKLFQGQFITIISSNPDSLLTSWTWNLVNITVSLAGYYLASFYIDHKLYGRKWMQLIGFFMCFLMFIIPAFKYDYYTSPAGIHGFQAMYFLSSFFNQFGPNSVTFLVAGEVYPTPIRATAHGFSACIGKAGALLASVLYNYIGSQTRFYVVPWFGLLGMVLTFIFLPDTTGLDLKEQERRWGYIREGKGKDYHGIAVHPKHLSLWERLRGESKSYNPDLDWKSKIDDMRRDWEQVQTERSLKKTEEQSSDELSTVGNDEMSTDIHNYFKRSSSSARLEANQEKQSHRSST